MKRAMFRRVVAGVLAAGLMSGLVAGSVQAAPEPQAARAATEAGADTQRSAQLAGGVDMLVHHQVIEMFAKLTETFVLCVDNTNAGRPCLQSEQTTEFKAVMTQLKQIENQLSNLQAQITDSFNALSSQMAGIGANEAYREVDTTIDQIKTAQIKLNELTGCFDRVRTVIDDKEAWEIMYPGAQVPPCYLSDANGNPEKAPDPSTDLAGFERYNDYRNPNTVQDLFLDLDKGSSGGPVARLVAATLEKWGGSTSSAAVLAGNPNLSDNLSDKARALLKNVGGTSDKASASLLYQNILLENSDLASELGAPNGSRPVFMPASYLESVNRFTGYYVQLESMFFASTMAALESLGAWADLSVQPGGALPAGYLDASTANTISSIMQSLVDDGENGDQLTVLDNQLKAYSFAPGGGYDWGDDCVTGAEAACPTDAWWVGSDHKLYRSTWRDYPADQPFSPSLSKLPFPDLAGLARLSQALTSENIKFSRAQQAFPRNLPTGDRPPVWTRLGDYQAWIKVDCTAEVFVASLAGLGACPTTGYTNNLITDTYGSQVFGDNVRNYVYLPCIAPVRMWDAKTEDMDAVGKLDADNYQATDEAFNSFDFTTRAASGSKVYNIQPYSRDQYDHTVTSGAIPIYGLTQNYYTKGVGTLVRCDGAYGPTLDKQVTPWYMTVQEETGDMSADTVKAAGKPSAGDAPRWQKWGAFRFMLPKNPPRYRTCKALRADEPNGVGKRGAKDRIRLKGKALKKAKRHAKRVGVVDEFYRARAYYKRNRHLDRDRDGIACELSRGHLKKWQKKPKK